MAWIIRCIRNGTVCIDDNLKFTLRTGACRDVDLYGRENAEKSMDLRVALVKEWVVTVHKDPAPGNVNNQEVLDALQAHAESAAKAATDAAEGKAALVEQNLILNKQLDEQRAISSSLMGYVAQIRDEVKLFAEKYPAEVKTFKTAMENASTEMLRVAEARASLPGAQSQIQGQSDAEIKTQDKILKMKQERLEKNTEGMGKTVSESSKNFDDVLQAMDDLGI